MDHKRAQDGDEGLNTGGMGTVAPNPYYTAGHRPGAAWRPSSCPPWQAMKAEGRPFKGCLYFGLMLTAERAQGHRVQLPLRRSGDAGGPAPSEKRPADDHAGRRNGTLAETDGGVLRRCRLLCHPGVQRLSRSTMKRASPSPCPRETAAPHLLWPERKLEEGQSASPAAAGCWASPPRRRTLQQAIDEAYAAAGERSFRQMPSAATTSASAP